MNILFLSNHLEIGGITSYLLNLSAGLSKRGHNIYIASSKGRQLPRFINNGITYIHIPIMTKQELSPKIMLSAFRLIGAVRKNHIDIVHSNSRTTSVLGSLLSYATGIAHVSTCHGFFKKRLSRKIFPFWGRRVIAISQSVKRHLIEDFNVDEKKIDVVVSGIDVNLFLASSVGASSQPLAKVKKDFGLKDGPVVGIVARLSEEKGHHFLMRAMQAVTAKLPEAQLLIAGEGKMKQELINLRKSLKLEDNCKFIPPVENTVQVLSVMDVFVLPSTKEGLGLALMEAMAAGLASIGSRVGGISSLINDGYNGLLVNPGDVEKLSQAILELLNDRGKRISLGQNARNFIAEKFSLENMARETEKTYLQCLN